MVKTIRTPGTIKRLALVAALVLAACQSDSQPPAGSTGTGQGTAGSGDKHPEVGAPPRQEPLVDGPYPAIVVAQAQFVDMKCRTARRSRPRPGEAHDRAAHDGGWKPTILEDPDSNVFHKAIAVATAASSPSAATRRCSRPGASPTASGSRHALEPEVRRQVRPPARRRARRRRRRRQGRAGDRDPRPGRDRDRASGRELARRGDRLAARHLRPRDRDRRRRRRRRSSRSSPRRASRTSSTRSSPARCACTSAPAGAGSKSIVDAPGDTHAKEILAADVDRDGTAELYVVWEGAIGQGGRSRRPVTIKQYRMKRTASGTSTVVADRARSPDARDRRRRRQRRRQDRSRRGRPQRPGSGSSSRTATGWKKTRSSTTSRRASSTPCCSPTSTATARSRSTSPPRTRTSCAATTGATAAREDRHRAAGHGDITWNLGSGRL